MALYRYFPTKEALVNALLDRVLGRFEPDPSTDDWVADLLAFARGHRRLLDRHPWALPAIFTHPTPGINATRIGEVLLAILARGRFASDSAVATFSGLLALNYGWVAFASARDIHPEQAAEQVRAAMANLNWADFPHTAAVAAAMADYGNERHYDQVLAQLVEGIRRDAGRDANTEYL
jgi:AcrR family transcriptional regulator